jgi:hypothetical protein
LPDAGAAGARLPPPERPSPPRRAEAIGSARLPRLRLVPGPRAGEDAVLAWVSAHLPRPGQGPLVPLRLIVPSRSLRLHLGAALVRRSGRALAGVQVQTLYAVAREILAAAGERVHEAGPLLAVLTRRLARSEPELERPLGRLTDGLASAAASVRDLLDAGLTMEAREPLLELATQHPAATPAERQRAAALLRVAAAVDQLRRSTGLDDRGRATLRAAEALAVDPALLRGRSLVWGFVDATGAATALLAALVRHHGAEVVVDLPATPGRVVPAGAAGSARDPHAEPRYLPDPAAARFARRLHDALLVAGAEAVGPRLGPGGQEAATAPAPAGDGDGELPPAEKRRQIALFAPGAWGAAPTSPLAATRLGDAGGSNTPGDAAEGDRSSADPGPAATAGPAPTVQRPAPAIPAPAAAPRIAAFLAPDPDSEAREVARQLRAAIDAGAVPEDLLVVARDLAPLRNALGRHLRRLGVPFSDLGSAGPPGPLAAQLVAFVGLLAEGERVSVDRWLALLAHGRAGQSLAGGLPVGDLRLAFAVLGAGRLGAVAGLDLDARLGGRPGLPLPVRRGIVDPASEVGGEAGELPDEAEGEAAEPAIEPPVAHANLELELPTSADGTARGQLALPLTPAVGRREPPPPAPPSAPVGTLARRQVAASLLRQLALNARGLVRLLAAWPRRAPWSTHRAQLLASLELLGWSPGPSPELATALEELAALVPGPLEIERDEVVRLLADTLERALATPLGGDGGGVQLLTATEARGRTAERLWLVGLLRGQFPRTVREDPLLGDPLRRGLRAMLPDLPVKGEGHDEERHLFASLLTAAPEVTLSWSARGDAGETVAPSPLVEELVWRLGLEPLAVGHFLDLDAPGPHAPAEQATRAALHGSRAQAVAHWGPAHELVRREVHEVFAVSAAAAGAGHHQNLAAGGARVVGERLEPGTAAEPPPPGARTAPASFPLSELPGPAALAVVRARVLAELDPDLRTADGRHRGDQPGPYLGWVGAWTEGDRADPRARPLGITALEGLATCPWRQFLRQGLGLAPPVEAFGVLPEVDARLLGTVVHAVLADLARDAEDPRREGPPVPFDAHRSDLAEATRRLPRPPGWPAAPELLARTREAAEAALRAEGRELPGLAEALAKAAQPLLAVAREEDLASPGVGILAAEVAGSFVLPDGTTLTARADRLDRTADGTLRLTDWKTGRLPAALGPVPEELRRQPLLARVTSGQGLQVPAYLLALAQAGVATRRDGEAARARLLSLRPDGAGRGDRELAASAADSTLLERFTAVAEDLLRAWRAGTLPPRLVDPSGQEEPLACRGCDLHLACHRGDSGLRRRLAQWLSLRRPAVDASAAANVADPTATGRCGATSAHPHPGDDAALRAVWALPFSRTPRNPAADGHPDAPAGSHADLRPDLHSDLRSDRHPDLHGPTGSPSTRSR